MRAIKAALDPDNIMNPGQALLGMMVAGLGFSIPVTVVMAATGE
jgi:hypothetical protein